MHPLKPWGMAFVDALRRKAAAGGGLGVFPRRVSSQGNAADALRSGAGIGTCGGLSGQEYYRTSRYCFMEGIVSP